jgi:dihydroxyacetone kinase-like protein
MTDTIGYAEFVRMLHEAVGKIRANNAELSKLDSMIGDGDHGTAIGHAMDAVEKAIQDAEGVDLKSLLTSVGWGVMSVHGGATGPLFGSFFMGLSEGVGETEQLDCAGVAAAFESGLANVSKQTRARVGDKTLMDALVPAVQALKEASESGKTLSKALNNAAEAAEKGAISTKDLVARFGRAKNYGDRTLGHQDPGATSISLIFRGLFEGLAGIKGD